VRVAAGGDHSLAVTSTGQLYAFGLNQDGQLGSATNSGTTNANPTPTLVSVAGGATIGTIGIGPDASHTLAVIADLVVSTSSLPGGTVGSPYQPTAQATGGATPYAWSASRLPPGLQINSSSGQISGTPTTAGGYTTTLTVTDNDGIVASRALQITISVPKPTTLRVSPRTFTLTGRKLNGRCVKPTAKNRARPHCRRPIKLTISYTLTGAASVKFTLKRTAPGRKIGGRCVKPTPKNRKHKQCTRLISVNGSIVRASHAGANSFTFTGKLGGHQLGPGTYQLTATTAGGSRSINFRIAS
jgi:hypothetical protein